MLDVKKLLTKMLSTTVSLKNGSLFTRSYVATSATIAGNGTAWINTTPPSKAIAMTGYYITGWGATAPTVYAMYMLTGDGTMAIKNNSSSAITISVTMYYLCMA